MKRDVQGINPVISWPQAILFDWDNTLVDTEKLVCAALNHTFESLGLERWEEEKILNLPQRSFKDKFASFFGSRWGEAQKTYYDYYQSVHLDRLASFLDSENLLRFLQGKSIFLGIVSNKKGNFLRREVEYLGWTGYFGSVIGSCDLDSDKPSSLTVIQALRPSGIPAGPEVWFVGDSAVDVECAWNAGCTSVLMDRGLDKSQISHPIHLTVKTCEELQNIVALWDLKKEEGKREFFKGV